jgi:hypothetical protein
MTDGPFRNAALSERWKKYGDDLVSDAASPSERTARICHSMLGDVDWNAVGPLLKQLEANALNSQLELDPCARIADIFDNQMKTPFSDSLQKHLTANLRENVPAQKALDMAVLSSVNDWVGTARSRIEEECIRARDVGDMSKGDFEKGMNRSRESFNAVDANQIAQALLAGDRQAFKQAVRSKLDVNDGPEG